MSLTICMERFYGELGFRGATRLHHNGFVFHLLIREGDMQYRLFCKTSDRGVGTSSGSFGDDVFDLWLSSIIFLGHVFSVFILRRGLLAGVLIWTTGHSYLHIWLLSLHFMMITYIYFSRYPSCQIDLP